MSHRTRLNEEEIKVKLVLPLLKELGFDPAVLQFEVFLRDASDRRQYVDIVVNADGAPIFLIETKAEGVNLAARAVIEQAANYCRSFERVIPYQPSPCGTQHGNFIPASYRALQRRPQWKRRFNKVHSQGGRAFPKSDCVSKELDSSMSSDALLMNIFCYPGVTKRRELTLMLGTEVGDLPEFGFKPRIPLTSGFVERTEIDMKLGPVLFEAKLTESDFQTQKAEIVEGYRDLKDVFEIRRLPRRTQGYVSYQLLRNVLAAHSLKLSFCVLLDARRPDLREQWYTVMSCVRPMDLRTRCKVVTWQELTTFLPLALQRFLDSKYGINSQSSSMIMSDL